MLCPRNEQYHDRVEPEAYIKDGDEWKFIDTEMIEVKVFYNRQSNRFLQEWNAEKTEGSESRPPFCALSPEEGPCHFYKTRS